MAEESKKVQNVGEILKKTFLFILIPIAVMLFVQEGCAARKQTRVVEVTAPNETQRMLLESLKREEELHKKMAQMLHSKGDPAGTKVKVVKPAPLATEPKLDPKGPFAEGANGILRKDGFVFTPTSHVEKELGPGEEYQLDLPLGVYQRSTTDSAWIKRYAPDPGNPANWLPIEQVPVDKVEAIRFRNEGTTRAYKVLITLYRRHTEAGTN